MVVEEIDATDFLPPKSSISQGVQLFGSMVLTSNLDLPIRVTTLPVVASTGQGMALRVFQGASG